MIFEIPSDYCSVLLFDSGLVVLLIRTRTREGDILGLTLLNERFINERAIVVGVDPNDRKWESCAKQLHRLNDQ